MSVTASAPAPVGGRAPLRALALPTIVPFSGLALYGALRWGTLLSPDPVGRLLGMWALTVAIALIGQTPLHRRTWVAAPVALLALLIVLPLGGFRVSWVLHLRIALILQTVGQGLQGLPAVLVPYNGVNEPIRQVMTVGAGVLLVDGAVMLAFAPKTLGELRTAVAALPLIVLAVVPAAMARPHAAYLQGVAMFVLVALLVWGERIVAQRRRPAVAAIMLVAAGVAVAAAPALDSGHPWLHFRNFASAFGPGRGERFDWNQGYGPISWPRKGHQVLEIQARFPSYWKTESLETFDGVGWRDEAAGYSTFPAAPASVARWTETLHVTDTDMSSSDVIAAGVAAAPPTHVPGYAIPGSSAGSWTLAEPLRPGDSYLVTVYAPHPTAAQLRAAGTAYEPALASGFLSINLPAFTAPGIGGVTQLTVFAPPFGSHLGLFVGGNITKRTSSELVNASPYGPAYRLAHRLAGESATPYDFAKAIERYLAHRFSYDEHPPASPYPIESFLFSSHRGYCQQFAGAMALLLRMGGVPARVATGFSTGTYNGATRSWSVQDIDAHAWVEAWFPGYGWVAFDPTPTADPALGGKIPPAIRSSSPAFRPIGHGLGQNGKTSPSTQPAPSAGGTGHHGGGGSSLTVVAAIAGAALLLALLGWVGLAARAARVDPVDELERAFARCGRPLQAGTTLQSLEHRFRHAPVACAYVRSLRLTRYAGADPAATGAASGRRAIRRQIVPSRGPIGWLRTLWALPPGWAGSKSAHRDRPGRRLKSDTNG